MEDDIYGMATEPILSDSNPSIYEEETQAIVGDFDVSPSLNFLNQNSSKNSRYIVCKESLPQRLDPIEMDNSFEGYPAHDSKDEDVVDSDCDTIPASPVFDLNSIEEDVDLNKSPVQDHFFVQSPSSSNIEKGDLPGGIAGVYNQGDLDYPTQPLPEHKTKSITIEDSSMDAPTQRLPEDKKMGTIMVNIGADEPTQMLPESWKANCSSLQPSVILNEISMDAPTQKLPETQLCITMSNKNRMDAPTQKLPETQLCITMSNENSMDAPTQLLLSGRKEMFALSDHEESMDAPTQPLPRRKGGIVSDNENSMDAVTQPLPKSQYNSKSPSTGYGNQNSKERPASPALHLGSPLTSKPYHVPSPAATSESDDETQRIDFDPESLFISCGSNTISPVPLKSGAPVVHKNIASASSTPYQHKKLPLNGAVFPPGESNREKSHAANSPPVFLSKVEEDESDAETLPGSPGFGLGTQSDIVLGSQEEDEELSPPLRRSLAWKGLQITGGCEKEDSGSEISRNSAISSPIVSPRKRQATDNKENHPILSKRIGGSTLQHESVLSSQDRTECESPVFDFDDSSDAVVDETQAASPLSYDNQGSPAFIAETPFIETGPSPRKKRKIIRRSGYCLNDSTFLLQSTISEDNMTEKVSENVPAKKFDPPLLPNLESEESDLELTFVSGCLSAPSLTPSKEPFVGFTKEERDEISGNLKFIQTVIDADEKELVDAEMQRQPAKPRRSSRRPVPNLRNTDLYEMGPSSSRQKRHVSPSSPSSATNSGVDMDIASSDDEQEADVARKRRTVSSTPSTTNITVDMEIVSSCDTQGQGESTPKPLVQSRHSKRSVDAAGSDLTTPKPTGIGDRTAKNVSKLAKDIVEPIHKTRSKRLSVADEEDEPAIPKSANVGGAERMDDLAQGADEMAVKLPENCSTRADLPPVSEIDERNPANREITASDNETVPRSTGSASNATEKGPHLRKVSDRIKGRKRFNKSEAAHTDPEQAGHVPPVQSEEETSRKQTKRGRPGRKASEAQKQVADLQNSENNEAKPSPKLVECSSKHREPPSRRNTRSRMSAKQNSSAADESLDDAEPKQTLATSAKGTTNEEHVDKGKAIKEETFHHPELPVRKARRRRAGSGASSTSNASLRNDAESSDETLSTNQRAPKRSASSAESSADEQPAGKQTKALRQARASALKANDSTGSTPNALGKRRGGRMKKDAFNDSVSSSSGASASRHPRLTNLNASVNNSPATETSRRRKRALAGQVRVLFTAIDDDNEREIIARLGGKVVTHFKDCSVLVTDRIRRTVKFLCCVGLGLPIVGLDWLEKCRASGKFLDPWSYLLQDKEGEEKFKFKLAESLKVASEKPLLGGLVFHATPCVKPPPVEMLEIVDACGGFYVEENDDNSPENKFVITCPEDKKVWSWLKKRGAKLVDKEAILTGVLQQSFEPEKFALS